MKDRRSRSRPGRICGWCPGPSSGKCRTPAVRAAVLLEEQAPGRVLTPNGHRSLADSGVFRLPETPPLADEIRNACVRQTRIQQRRCWDRRGARCGAPPWNGRPLPETGTNRIGPRAPRPPRDEGVRKRLGPPPSSAMRFSLPPRRSEALPTGAQNADRGPVVSVPGSRRASGTSIGRVPT